jgi:hypothetical protein
MALDVSGLSYFSPVIAFLLVTSVSFAVLLKTKIFGEHKLGLLFVSFLIATLFIFVAGARSYVETVTPWFVILLISLFFILLLSGFSGSVPKGFNTGLGISFTVLLLLIFLVSGVVVFSDSLAPYLPGNVEYRTTPLSSWFYSSHVFGAIILLIVAGIASVVLLKVAKK